MGPCNLAWEWDHASQICSLCSPDLPGPRHWPHTMSLPSWFSHLPRRVSHRELMYTFLTGCLVSRANPLAREIPSKLWIGCQRSCTPVSSSQQQYMYHAEAVPTCSYKFWTCCLKRTSDFNEFLKQEGCTTGDHVWIEVRTLMCSQPVEAVEYVCMTLGTVAYL